VLAYVFWHWPRADAPRSVYEALQQPFHEALRRAPPPGFLGSRVLALAGAPWAAEGRDAYEDWYLVEGSAALDPLNEAAVNAPRRAAHDAVASASAGGTAGLYRLRMGEPGDVPHAAAWFAKPPGMSYSALYNTLEPLVRSEGTVLWARQMTLGPTPEFCLQSARAIELPAAFFPAAVRYRTVWPPTAPA
jgi:hypothetical protein